MSTSTQEPVLEQNPVEIPLYTSLDAAHYLHLPVWAMGILTGRYRHWPQPEWFFHHFPLGFPQSRTPDDALDFCHHDHQAQDYLSSVRRLVCAHRCLADPGGLGEIWRTVERPVGKPCRNLQRGLEDDWNAPDLFEATGVEERLEPRDGSIYTPGR